jgi:Binding-protein-dependent transport system inner membrane component
MLRCVDQHPQPSTQRSGPAEPVAGRDDEAGISDIEMTVRRRLKRVNSPIPPRLHRGRGRTPGAAGPTPRTAQDRTDWSGACQWPTRASWLSALVVIASGVLIGGLIGTVAGIAGGWLDTALMRFTDLFLALPAAMLAIAVIAALGASVPHTLVAVSIVWWPWYARIVRGEVRAQAVRSHVDAARLAGVGRTRLALRHLLPGAFRRCWSRQASMSGAWC